MNVDATVDTPMRGEPDRLDRGATLKCQGAQRCAVDAETIGCFCLRIEEALEVLVLALRCGAQVYA